MPGIEVVLDIRRFIGRFSRFHRWILRAAQLAIFVIAAFSAFLLRFDLFLPQYYRRHFLAALVVWVLVKVPVFHAFGLDRGWWRYASLSDLLRLLGANVAGSAIGCLCMLLLGPGGFPRSLYIIDLLLCFLMTGGIRLAVRMIYEFSHFRDTAGTRRTLIYGAGDAGVALLREIRQNAALAYEVVGFIDDSKLKVGTRIHRTPVFGNGSVLPSIVKKHSIEMVLIALPSATGAKMTAVLRYCQEAGVAYKTIPGFAEVIETSGLAAQIRDVSVEDLLGRHPVRLEEAEIRARIENRVVAVTGAAGSIGSELCRQIARFHPAAIVAYDCAETPLFYIEREMRESFPGVRFYAEMGDIRHPKRLAEVFEKYRPSILYHAAAYKHVPMMESSPFEAVENNVIGTWNVACAAAKHGIEDFVMISSDKAVRPTNVMGCTKRIAELLINALQNGGTKFVSVRFGNVLGSNGSVIPLFKQQIAARKPLTVTDPEMRRYFMTIPEAAQLVLQASTMSKGGEVFVLDMGEPVRIVDLAHNLILLSGLRPNKDIRIEFTGSRPGEKLFEELAHLEEETLPTYHPKIKIFANGHRDASTLERVELLRKFSADRDLPGLVLQLKDLVPDYNPSSHLLRRVVGPVSPVPTKLLVRAAVSA